MENHIRVQLLDLCVEIEDTPISEFFATWRWRLDPYRTTSGKAGDVLLKRDPQKLPFQSSHILYDEGSGFFHRQVLRAEDGGTLWQYVRSKSSHVHLQYAVSPTWDTITLLYDDTNTAEQLALEYLGQMMPAVMLNHEALTFHGVLMEHEGRGIILSADSGVGKTTHARLWRDCEQALILNGDRAVCKKADGVWTGCGLPWSGTSGEHINRSVSIAALVVLERGEKNEAQRITGLEAFGSMWPNVLHPEWDETLTDTALKLADDFLCAIPVIRLCCRPDSDAVQTLKRALEEL